MDNQRNCYDTLILLYSKKDLTEKQRDSVSETIKILENMYKIKEDGISIKGFTVDNVSKTFVNMDKSDCDFEFNKYILTDEECESILNNCKADLVPILERCKPALAYCDVYNEGLSVIEEEIKRFFKDFDGELDLYKNEFKR